jgi:hypothetical protein
VTLTSPQAMRPLHALPGSGEPRLSGGVGGTSTLDLPRDTQAVHWETHPPFSLSLPLQFEGHAEGRSVESECGLLLLMARAPEGAARPPTVFVEGPVTQPMVPRPFPWLIEDLAWGDSIRRDGDDARVRQAVVVQLIQDHRAELVLRAETPSQEHRRRPPPPLAAGVDVDAQVAAARTASGRTYVARAGDTLPRIAARLRLPGGWRPLAELNDIRDPGRLREGQRLRLP